MGSHAAVVSMQAYCRVDRGYIPGPVNVHVMCCGERVYLLHAESGS